MEGIEINDYKITNKKISVDISSELKEEEQNLIFTSLFNNYDTDLIEILVNGEKKYEKTKKDIEN